MLLVYHGFTVCGTVHGVWEVGHVPFGKLVRRERRGSISANQNAWSGEIRNVMEEMECQHNEWLEMIVTECKTKGESALWSNDEHLIDIYSRVPYGFI